jgi:formylglycine-generating enzyme required for sulfatase activity
MLHGLHAAHEAKGPTGEPLELVHRDVSPENILVGTDGVARLLDFGMARAVDRLHLTQAGQVKGKLTVMAPEQVQGNPVTRLTDIFASGVVLWQALTAQRLIKGEHIAEIAHNVVNQRFEPPSKVVPDLPRKLDAIVMRALERRPEARWPSADKMVAAIEAIGAPASQRDVGQWVERVAWEKLAERTAMVAAIDSTPVGGVDAPSPPERASESSVGPVASSAPRPGDRLSHLAAAARAVTQRWLVALRRLFERARERDENGKLRLPAVARDVVRQRPGTTLAVVGGLLLFVVVLAVALSGDDPSTAVAAAPDLGAIAPEGKSAKNPSPPPPVASSAPQVKADSPTVTVAAGEFTIGCNGWADRACAVDEQPGRRVMISAFAIDRTEVTVSRYRECVEAGKCSKDHLGSDGTEGMTMTEIDRCNYGREGRDEHPMNCVSYQQATAFCSWAGGRLPSEAEWQKAAGGSDSWPFPSGEPTISCAQAVMDGDGCGRGTTWPVASKPKGVSPYGAHDMAGNVAEWVADWYSQSAFRDGEDKDPKGPAEGTLRVVRGGSWRDVAPQMLRSSARQKRLPATHSIMIGFRCAHPVSVD